MANDELVLRPKLGQPGQRQPSGDAGFWESAWSAGTSELVGYDAPQDVRRYRAQNPWAAFGSQALGMAPLFVVPMSRFGLAGIRALPVFGRGIRSGERLMQSGRPALGMAARDVTAMTAAETARLGATAALHGPTSEEVQEVAGQAAFDIGATGAISGIVGHLSRALPPPNRPTNFEKQVQQLDPDFNMNATPQDKMQRMMKLTETVEDQGIKDELFRHIGAYGKVVRRADPPEGRNAVQKLAEFREGDPRNLAGALSRMFRVKDTKEMMVRKLEDTKKFGGFGKKGMTRSVLERAELPLAFEKNAYWPRYVKPKTKEQARKTQRQLNRMSSPISSGGRQIWLAREADDGAYVMARRVDRKEGPIEANDEFLIFKTDNPAMFAPEVSGFTKKLDQEAMRLEAFQNAKPVRGVLPQAYETLRGSTPDTGVLSGEMASAKSGQEVARRWAESFLGQERVAKLRHVFGGTADFVGKITREYAAPTINRYGGKNGSARAASISLTSKVIHDRARMEITHLLSGELDKTYKNAILKDIFQAQTPRKGGLYKAIDNLPDEALPDISQARRLNMSIADMRESGMSSSAIEFMKRLEHVDQRILDDFNATMEYIGWPEFQGMENHYMLSRMWEGRLRLPIKKKNGSIVSVAGGKNHKEVLDEAERLQAVINESNTFKSPVSFNKGDIRYADEGDDLRQALEIGDANVARSRDWLRKARDPKRFQERKGVGGFKFETSDMTHKDLRDTLRRQVSDMYNLAAHRLAESKLRPEIYKLWEEDPAFARAIEKELMSRFGQRGQWTKATEDAVDRILTPVFGTRASEIVRSVNNAVFQLTLGMGNVGFAALNAVTFMQTALPEISWLLSAAPSRIRDMYGHAIVKSPQGVREIRYLEPLRFVKKAWDDISKPPDELWEIYKRARDEGRVAPVLSEEVFGPNSDIMLHMKGFFKERRTLPELIGEMSAYMPARTEEMSRAMALSMGWRMGRDFMRLEGEQLYQFATRFVDNTHFRYSSSDRPLLLRGAFGSLIGLFKSWMLHYTGNMTRYASDGWRQGNIMPLLWSQAGTMSVAGLSGSAVMPVAEGLHALTDDEPMVQNIYEGLGWKDTEDATFLGSPADVMMYGLPAFLNLSLSHRAAVPGADVPNDIEQLYSVMHWDRAVAVGDLIGASMDSFWATGEHPAKSQQTMDAMYRAFLPRTLQTLMQNVNQRGTRSLRTQNTVLSDTTWGEAAIASFGFQPNRLARAYEQMDIMFERQEELNEAIAAFGEMYTQARMAGDAGAMQNVLMRAQYAGVPIDRIIRSADSRQAKRQEGLIERQFDDYRNMALRRALGGG